MSTTKNAIVILALTAVIMVTVTITRRDRETQRELERMNAAAQDSIAAWRTRYREIASRSVQVDTVRLLIRQRAAVSRDSSDVLRARIDALLDRGPALADSITYWRELYEVRTREVTQVRATLASVREERSLLLADRDRWRNLAREADTLAEHTRTALEAERRARGCAVVCIPRGVLVVAGMVLGAVVTR